jgi:hypothetical protein
MNRSPNRLVDKKLHSGGYSPNSVNLYTKAVRSLKKFDEEKILGSIPSPVNESFYTETTLVPVSPPSLTE